MSKGGSLYFSSDDASAGASRNPLMLIGSKYPAVRSADTRSATGPIQVSAPAPLSRLPTARYHLLMTPLVGGIPINPSDTIV